ncbi:STAS domain-containing protein [Methanospirillum stamsii]|uniref:Anti-sigma factor antagonist n=1 Tax=Methanospirillum stamsii TaxID=1277351 RepID=A0A2V2MVI7_9EURY|nr:STAS domain-containing protein [Methanospirillum stamsii]PWR70310.1 anti-sigma factor antagonist [Methanospirillum stamsii]
MECNLNITEREISGITILDISGRVDAATSSKMEEELTKKVDAGVINIIMNMENLSYISSSGLRVILASLKKVKSAGGKIALLQLQPGPAEVFKMTGFDRLFPICSSMEGAVEQFSA